MHGKGVPSQIDPSKIELLAVTGHLSRCVRALDSNGTTEPDLDDIIAKHPGYEKINNEKGTINHNPMFQKDWEKLFRLEGNYWPMEPSTDHQKTIVNILRTLDTQAAGALSGLRNADIQPIARKISEQDWNGTPKPSFNTVRREGSNMNISMYTSLTRTIKPWKQMS